MKKKYCKRDGEGNITAIFREPLLHDGEQIFNPGEELMTSLGWEVLEAQPHVKRRPATAERLAAMEAILYVPDMADTLPDDDAIALKAIFPAWADHLGETMEPGRRYYHDDRLWKVLQRHTSQADWAPDKAASLFVEVSAEEWPAWRQPLGTTDAYAKGDKVTHLGTRWQSTADANVWEPGVYGWEAV